MKLDKRSKQKIGQRMRELRETRGMTQEDLADKVGLTQFHISHFECGRRLPSVDNFINIVKAMDGSIDLLVDNL